MKDKITWKYEKRKINDLIENKDNPRRLSKQKAEKLQEILEELGLCQPLVIQPDGKLVGGHQRLKILRALGHGEVDVSIPSRELSEREAEKLTIGLNKICGEFDFDMLANRWDPVLLCEAGFTEEELQIEIEPKQKPKSLSISLKFEKEDDLKYIKDQLEALLQELPEVNMKVRCK